MENDRNNGSNEWEEVQEYCVVSMLSVLESLWKARDELRRLKQQRAKKTISARGGFDLS